MSEPTMKKRDELLNFLKAWRSDSLLDDCWNTDDEVAFRAIRALIEHGPEVSEEQIRQISKSISSRLIFTNSQTGEELVRVKVSEQTIIESLIEAGMMMKEEKTIKHTGVGDGSFHDDWPDKH